MSKLYKKVDLLVSRSYYHETDGSVAGGLEFFRSMDEYNRLAQEGSWNEGDSFWTHRCPEPVVVSALVLGRDYARFMQGFALHEGQVFFAATLTGLVEDIGRQ